MTNVPLSDLLDADTLARLRKAGDTLTPNTGKHSYTRKVAKEEHEKRSPDRGRGSETERDTK